MITKKKQPINIFKRIIGENWEEFKKRYPVYDSIYYNEVVKKMLNCGDIKYGYTEYMCCKCGGDKVSIPFSCKSKFCLSCGKVSSDDLTEAISSNLFDEGIYRHLSLTIPEQFRIYFYQDRKYGDLLKALYQRAWECIQDVIQTVRRRKLKCGCIMMLHSVGRKGNYNPHLHIILLDGGLDEEKNEWVKFGWFPYGTLHKKWEYHLFNMMEEEIATDEMSQLISDLWKKYPNGLVANIKRGEIPEKNRGLAKYLTKYISSPAISLRRIKEYDPEEGIVEYVYKSHETGKEEKERTDVFTFIGRMVQQILPKGFKRIHYFGLQATKTIKKYTKVLPELFKSITKAAKNCYKVVKKKYRDRYKEVNRGKDPFICSKCGEKMKVVRIWSRTHGLIYDWFAKLEDAPPISERNEPVVEEKELVSQQVVYGIQLAFDF